MNKPLFFSLSIILLSLACTSSKKFTSIRTVYDKDAQMRPGAPVAFGVVAQHKNGKKIITKGYLKGKYKIDNYEVQVIGGWQDGGVIFIDTAEDRNVNRSVKVIVNPVKRSSLKDSFEFKLNYEGIVTWNFSGETGESGDSKGSRVLPIRIGGTALASGKDGEAGLDGSSGLSVNLYVYKVSDSDFYRNFGYDLYAVKCTGMNGGVDKFTFVAQKYGKLILKLNGGDGGAGGNGGPGPDGFDADNNKTAGNGKDGGIGGTGGAGGNGGNVKIFLDSSASDFVNYLEVQNHGGKGGLGGRGGAAGQGGKPGGYNGRAGANGRNGNNGMSGNKPEIVIDYVRF